MQNNRAGRPMDILQWDSRKCFKNPKESKKPQWEEQKQKTNHARVDLNLTILILTSNVNGHYTSIKRQRLPEWIND